MPLSTHACMSLLCDGSGATVRRASSFFLLIPIPRDLVRAGLSSRCSRRPAVPDVLLRLASKKRWVNPCIRCPPSRPQAREEDSWKRRDVKLHAHLSLAKSQKSEAHDKQQVPRTSSGSVCPLCILPILDPQSTGQVIVPRAGSVRSINVRTFLQVVCPGQQEEQAMERGESAGVSS